MHEDNVLLIHEDKKNNIRICFEFAVDVDIHELMTKFKELALAIGYHPNSVDDGFLAMAEEIEGYNERQEQNSENDKTD